jgi:hypothetical protein
MRKNLNFNENRGTIIEDKVKDGPLTFLLKLQSAFT